MEPKSASIEDTKSPSRRRKVAVYLQDACLKHRYIRSNDLSTIVERPERVRAVKLGISAAIARLEEVLPNISKGGDVGEDELAAALQKLNLGPAVKIEAVDLILSSAAVNLLSNPAVKFVHGDIEGDVYLEKLIGMAKESRDKIAEGGSEVPDGYSQGDLYLCPESIEAIQGALGTVCEAVDTVITSSRNAPEQNAAQDPAHISAYDAVRCFVAVRPPGHHCGEDTPSGFCFVNNVLVAAAHAHLAHGITKAVVLDIDLHHGNGSQSIAWQINEETYRQKLEAEKGENPGTKPGLQVYYGSIHDILSYPCEDGNAALIQAASTSIHGPHGQYIENIHLQEYSSEQDFWDRLYPQTYAQLLRKAESFVRGSDGDEVIVFVSCGFDASEHEYASMSRHNRKVPADFYTRFALDACRFATTHAKGKLVSVLEGGYSDRALTSGAMAHLAGLVDMTDHTGAVSPEWWGIDNLILLEKVLKKRRGGKSQPRPSDPPPKWLARAQAIFSSIDVALPALTTNATIPHSMMLRDRSAAGKVPSARPSPRTSLGDLKAKITPQNAMGSSHHETTPALQAYDSEATEAAENPNLTGETTEHHIDTSNTPTEPPTSRKLPRVILRVKQPDEDVAASH